MTLVKMDTHLQFFQPFSTFRASISRSVLGPHRRHLSIAANSKVRVVRVRPSPLLAPETASLPEALVLSLESSVQLQALLPRLALSAPSARDTDVDLPFCTWCTANEVCFCLGRGFEKE